MTAAVPTASSVRSRAVRSHGKRIGLSDYADLTGPCERWWSLLSFRTDARFRECASDKRCKRLRPLFVRDSDQRRGVLALVDSSDAPKFRFGGT